MNYLGRPVFPFTINWANPVNKSFTYDLREQKIGFAAEYFASLQQNVAQGFQITTWLQSNSDIAAFDAFTAALCGRLAGFWLPAPFEDFTITFANSHTQFQIAPQGLADDWENQPDIYLYFSAPGQTPVCAKINSVIADGGGGYETVFINADVLWLATTPPSQISVMQLHYVRLADDVEQGKFLKENSQARTLKMIELPEEYTNVETGAQRIYLYVITASAPVGLSWTYTNFAAPISSLGVTYNVFPMQHKSLKRGTTLDGEGLEIDAKYDPNHPFSLWLPVPFAVVMNIQIFETTFADVDDQTIFFSGRIVGVKDSGEKLTATCKSFEYLLTFKIPGPLIGPDCPWCLFDSNTCKAPRAGFEITGTITAIASDTLPPTVSLTFGESFLALPQAANWETADWFAQGLMETGYQDSYEMRVIQHSTWDSVTSTLTLALNAELVHAAVGENIQLVAGCDGQAATCQSKFNNYKNFGGFPGVPVVNPSLDSFAYYQAQGGKGK
jgi:uncharacterized phage protein (TIGR02218 family)